MKLSARNQLKGKIVAVQKGQTTDADGKITTVIVELPTGPQAGSTVRRELLEDATTLEAGVPQS